MKTLQGVGCSVGEYVGDGQGEAGISEQAVESGPLDADAVVDEEVDADDNCEGDDERHPMLVLFDCETTGFSIYSDHITDIGAKVVATPVPVSKPTFSSLVRTPRNIPAPGKHNTI